MSASKRTWTAPSANLRGNRSFLHYSRARGAAETAGPFIANSTTIARRTGPVAQASTPASSRTVPVRGTPTRTAPLAETGGETPPELAAGTAELRALPDVLKRPPIFHHGNMNEIIGKFGGADQLRTAVNQLQSLLTMRFKEHDYLH